MNCVLWCVLCWILWSAFVGHCTEYTLVNKPSDYTNGGQFTEQILEKSAQCVCPSVVHDYIFPIFESERKDKTCLNWWKIPLQLKNERPTWCHLLFHFTSYVLNMFRTLGPRRDEVTGEWRRLHNEELNDLYSSPNIVQVIKSRRMRWAGHVARMGEEKGAYRVLVGKPEGKRPLGRPRRRWVDNIRMDLQEVGCGYVDWIGLAQDRDRWRTLVSAVMNLWVP